MRHTYNPTNLNQSIHGALSSIFFSTNELFEEVFPVILLFTLMSSAYQSSTTQRDFFVENSGSLRWTHDPLAL